MRQAVVQAVHHASHRRAFQKHLVDQPLMRVVLADLVMEWLAATMMVMRVARAYDEAADDEATALFARLAVAVTKFWVNKRLPGLVYEAMECLGGSGYVEESMLPRLYREAPLNSIWEGSGNVICLDVLRTIERTPAAMEVFLDEIEATAGGDRRLDALIGQINPEAEARLLVQDMALALQASLVLRHAPSAMADAFVGSRLDAGRGLVFGTLAPGSPCREIIELAQVGA
jgi:putative acyl-CoA dehydrogenase